MRVKGGFCFIMKKILIISTVLMTMVVFVTAQQPISSGGYIKNLNAPALGITSSTVILLWDDIFEQDLADDSYSVNAGSYDIYQDGKKIASTKQHTCTVKNLLPNHTYSFSVFMSENRENKFPDKNSIKVTTRQAGKVVNIKQTGATGDGITQDTKAIQKAINLCEEGGTVLVPAGKYLTGPLVLKSNMTLEIEKGGLLQLISFDEYKKLSEKPGSLITGTNVHHVVITGEGVIDATGETWWPHFPDGIDRVDGIGRPFVLQFTSGSDILVQGITIQDSPRFNNVLHNVDRIIYSDVKFLKYSTVPGRNGDALDIYSSRNVLIVGCIYGNQDDSIVIKGNPIEGKFNEYITILDCNFDGNAAPGAHPLGFACGSESNVKHVIMKNCIFIDAASIANIKTNRSKLNTFAEDIRIENITYINTKHKDEIWNRAPISIDQFYYGAEGDGPLVRQPLTPETPVFRDIHFRNIKIINPVGRGIYVSGFAELPVNRVSFVNVIVKSRDGVNIQNVNNILMQSVKIEVCDSK